MHNLLLPRCQARGTMARGLTISLLALAVCGGRAQIFPNVFGSPTPPPPPPPPPAQATPSSLLTDLRNMGGAQPMGGAMGGAAMGGQPQQATIELPDDLGCASGPHAAAWGQTKKRFRALFSASPFALVDRAALSAAVDGALADLKSVGALQAADQCGVGKLCLQLLSFANVDDPTALVQLFAGFEQLTSPVLTLLLDVPWAVLAQSGWPVFAMLAQLNMRKGQVPEALNSEAVDGLNDPTGQEFMAYLMAGLQAGNIPAVEQVSAAFLQMGGVQGSSALAPLTALAAQGTGSRGVQAHLEVLRSLQDAFKQVIGSGDELDVALSTRWPLWGFVHVGVDALYPED